MVSSVCITNREQGKDLIHSAGQPEFCLPPVITGQAGSGGSQARGRIGAVATGLHNAGSEPRLRPIPHLTAMPDP